MRKLFIVCIMSCLCFSACKENDELVYEMPYPGWFNNLFAFAILDSDGNNVCFQDDFNSEELLLEYNGKIFSPKDDVFQRVNDENQNDGDRFDNSIMFEKLPHYEGELVAWRIWGYTYLGEPDHYILRYKNNEWIVDFKSEKRKGDGKSPKTEAVVNGEKIELSPVYNRDKSIQRQLYVLQTE